MPSLYPNTFAGRLHHATGLAGATVLLLLMTAVIPAVFPWLPTLRPSVFVGKAALMAFLGAAAIALGAVAIWGPAIGRYRHVVLPSGALALYLALCFASMLASDAFGFSFRRGMIFLAGAGAALTAPLFLVSTRRVALLMAGLMLVGVFVATTVLAATLGDRSFNRAVWLHDPRDVPDDPTLREALLEQQRSLGGQRAFTLSTLGNPEYVAGFLAVAVAVMIAALIDWVPRLPRAPILGVVLLGVIVLVLAAIAFTQTRSAWLAVAGALLARALLTGPHRGWLLALFVGGSALAGTLAGPLVMLGILAAGAVLAIAVEWRTGALARRWQAVPRSVRALVVVLPLLFAFAVGAVVFTGRTASISARLLARFSTTTNLKDESVQTRLVFYMIAGEITRTAPLLGVGPGFFTPRFYPALATIVEEDESGTLRHVRANLQERIPDFAHSDYFQLAAEQGLLGLGSFLLCMVLVLQALRRACRSADPALAGTAGLVATGLLASLAVSLFSGPLHFPDRAAVFWMLVACALAVAALDRETPSDAAPAP